MHRNTLQQDLLRDVWITSGIFSNHYLLERLANNWWKILRFKEKFGK